MRGYKPGVLSGIPDDSGIAEEIVFGTLKTHDMEQCREMLKNPPCFHENDVLKKICNGKLSFLIESRNLNQITVALSYRNHLNIEISLNNRNTIGFDEDKYLGKLIQGSREERIATCILSLYTEILE